MNAHLRLAFANRAASDEAVLQGLPTPLRRRILRHMYLGQLTATALFRLVWVWSCSRFWFQALGYTAALVKHPIQASTPYPCVGFRAQGSENRASCGPCVWSS